MNDSPSTSQEVTLRYRLTALQEVRLFLSLSILINTVVVIFGVGDAYGLGSVLGFSGSMLLALWPYALLIAGLALLLALSTSRYAMQLVTFTRRIFKGIAAAGFINLVFFIVLIGMYGYARLSGRLIPFVASLPAIWVFGHMGLLGAIFLSATRRIKPGESLLVSFSIYGLFLWLFYFIPDISNYPLALGWSETSRYYYASLFFSPLIYGKWVPLSSLHPTRYLMQSLPFLIPALPLWVHRAWQVILWLGMTLLAGFALARRIKPGSRRVSLGIAAWFFMFSFQGPVYYHLMVVVILVLMGFNQEKLHRSLGFVALASLWAGISRVNWFPVGGMLAVALYVLEVPQGEKKFWAYWRWPVLAVGLGLLLAYGSQFIYTLISGNPPEVFASSFNSPLFKYRLFPNEAYGPGIINLALTASFPLLIILVWGLIPRLSAWRFLRVLALFSLLIALLGAGLIVSMKIGGGDNLHNMDSFLVMLAVIAAYVGFNRFEPDDREKAKPAALPLSLVVLALIIPVMFALDMLRPIPQLDHKRAWADIQQLQQVIDETVSDGGEVLFIQHRHLLTFNMIEGVSLVPEYEKVFLMEMAMSDNQVYLNLFRQDLENHRFDLIIVSPLAIITRPDTDVFGEENNVWVERVAQPLAASYYAIIDLRESDLSILAPKVAQ